MATVRELLCADTDFTDGDARRDAEILLSHCLGRSRAWLYTWPENEVAVECAQRFRQLLAQRRSGEPVAYLVGEREFWTLSLSVNRDTLIPRPETETLVNWALELSLPDNASVLDLGTGTGAIALAVASARPGWDVTAVDASEAALQVARANGVRNALQRVSFLHSDWYAAVQGRRFHALMANPPYVDCSDPHLARGDLRFEPRSALVSDEGGLADLRQLVAGAPVHLRDGGWLLLEHGFDQAHAVRAMLRDAGFDRVDTRCDLEGRERISGGCWRAD
jgi:release factor glutamine methyltransferase